MSQIAVVGAPPRRELLAPAATNPSWFTTVESAQFDLPSLTEQAEPFGSAITCFALDGRGRLLTGGSTEPSASGTSTTVGR